MAHTTALLIQHDIARKMQKLNEGHLQVALHPTLLLLLHFLLLLQLPLLLLLPAAATKIRKRIKRIRENSSTISHLFVSSSSSRDGSSPGGWLGWVAWWAWSTGIKCQLEFQVRSPLGRVQPWPTPKASNTPPRRLAPSSSSSFASSSPSLR